MIECGIGKTSEALRSSGFLSRELKGCVQGQQVFSGRFRIRSGFFDDKDQRMNLKRSILSFQIVRPHKRVLVIVGRSFNRIFSVFFLLCRECEERVY